MAGGLHKFTVQEAQNASLGQSGSIFVSGTSEVTMLEDTVFANDGLSAEIQEKYPDDTGTGTDISTANGAAIDGETFPKGVTIYGRWTSFKLASGLVIAYRG